MKGNYFSYDSHSFHLQSFNVPSNKVDHIDKVDNAVMTESSNLLTR